MNIERSVPKSSATFCLDAAVIILVIAIGLLLVGMPFWVVSGVLGFVGLFVFFAIECILDVQEYKMRLEERILEQLVKIEKKGAMK